MDDEKRQELMVKAARLAHPGASSLEIACIHAALCAAYLQGRVDALEKATRSAA